MSMMDRNGLFSKNKQRKRQTKELPPLPDFLESDSDSQSEVTRNTAKNRNQNQVTNSTATEDNEELSEKLKLGFARFWDREKGGWELISIGEKELRLLKLEKRRG